MIDLNYTRTQMLSHITSSGRNPEHCVSDPNDPSFLSGNEVRLLTHGQTPKELLPDLSAAFLRRFAHVPPERVFTDLNYPLKKGVGNAFKWGNGKDPGKRILVDAVVTKTGALVSISDEGEGFDARQVLERFRRDEVYFNYGGSGFVQFEKAWSLISYADGGRTLLIRFLCLPEPVEQPTAAERATFGAAGDEAFMERFLSSAFPAFGSKGRTLESCRIYVPQRGIGDHLELLYVLKFRKKRSQELETRILTGRLLAQEWASSGYSIASQLSGLPFPMEEHIAFPEPVAALEQPPMLFFEFQRSQKLRDHLKRVSDYDGFARTLTLMAEGLRAFHQSQITLPAEETVAGATDRLETVRRRIVRNLTQNGSSYRAERAERLFVDLADRGTRLGNYEPVPTHGDFGWHSIVHGDGRFYFYPFDKCRYSHPAFDVGGFLADMQRFYELGKKKQFGDYPTGCEIFLDSYFAGDLPPWHEELPYFVRSAMILRLDRLLKRPKKKWEPKIDALMEKCEVSKVP